ncbi:MAG TPA: metalloregulator ArsR/SmtB family transcription factor [Chloroflexota bacterium]|nr:metalloregulator ArsR/SmtB family transcription factor [Chloroflexota bacterium]
MTKSTPRAVGAVNGRRDTVADQLRIFKAALFKALAHPSRIKILDLLRERSLTVSELQVELGIEPSSVSQQLAILRAQHLVDGRREGTNVHYSVRDPHIFTLLDAARVIFDNHLITLRTMAGEDSG